MSNSTESKNNPQPTIPAQVRPGDNLVVSSVTIRVLKSFNYNNFEVSAVLQKENGGSITQAEINEQSRQLQDIADRQVSEHHVRQKLAAVNEFKEENYEEAKRLSEEFQSEPKDKLTEEKLDFVERFGDYNWQSVPFSQNLRKSDFEYFNFAGFDCLF